MGLLESLAETVGRHGGVVVDTESDGAFCVFSTVDDAAKAIHVSVSAKKRTLNLILPCDSVREMRRARERFAAR